MTNSEYGEIKSLYEKVCYWREAVDSIKRWQQEIKNCKDDTYQTYPKCGIWFRLGKAKKKEDVKYVFGMNVQGFIHDCLLPLESIDVLAKWAEEQLQEAENALSKIEVKGVQNNEML